MSDVPFSSANHPIWGWSKAVIGIIAVAVVLAMNANDFDQTEIKAIIEFALIAFGVQGLHGLAKAKLG